MITNDVSTNHERFVFISYCRDDNEPQNSGWVTRFDKTLNEYVKMRLKGGGKLKCWRDERYLEAHAVLDEALETRVRSSEFMVCVVSHNYMNSAYCMMEVRLFHQHLGQRLYIGEKMRLFKALINNIPLHEQQPEILQKSLGYHFYDEQERERRYPRQFRPEFGGNDSNLFYQNIDKLARDIKELCYTIENNDGTPTSPSNSHHKTRCLYLAETTSDLNEERELLRYKLEQSGYQVFPKIDKLLPNDSSIEKTINTYLDQCILSIHLVGISYGIIPEGNERSVMEIQGRLANQCSQNSKEFSCLIFMKEGLEIKDERQKQFVKFLHKEAYVIETNLLEEWETEIYQRLKSTNINNFQSINISGSNQRQVYLVYDKTDIDAVSAIRDDLKQQQRFQVIESPLPRNGSDNDFQLRRTHKEYLKSCDSLIIYWGNAEESWVTAKLRELLKVHGSRSSPIPNAALCLSEPLLSLKRDYQTDYVSLVISGFEVVSSDDVAAFIDRIV
ncbi:MAG: toll/interleukin-1 receptor domain-containing protein [Nostoc sp. DedSLP03]|uniref:toll/interleukin-1 receptor domain-containing protein n=1 Tax=Nostoc sp. DedSLP03 TaxID=3075400 RepID=UPI002AD29858|nr:toll/interleukin-1 receptor domain-containing protein [Nostoc sp. DedSLP03]MDZ7966359.1 toll/interleukin-1 receptor domain-containing protein [Nostoc sp. DedSLP03]